MNWGSMRPSAYARRSSENSSTASMSALSAARLFHAWLGSRSSPSRASQRREAITDSRGISTHAARRVSAVTPEHVAMTVRRLQGLTKPLGSVSSCGQPVMRSIDRLRRPGVRREGILLAPLEYRDDELGYASLSHRDEGDGVDEAQSLLTSLE
jgi:hypothetical protein